jgi:hypothetical protein
VGVVATLENFFGKNAASAISDWMHQCMFHFLFLIFPTPPPPMEQPDDSIEFLRRGLGVAGGGRNRGDPPAWMTRE